MDLAENLIKANEGLRLKLYKCTSNKQTIGYGYNIEDNGISLYVAELLLALSLEECERDLKKFSFWKRLSSIRKAVLSDMRYQLGNSGLSKFKKMIKALEAEDYQLAAVELLDSDYAKQTPRRAKRNAYMLKRGKIHDDLFQITQ